MKLQLSVLRKGAIAEAADSRLDVYLEDTYFLDLKKEFSRLFARRIRS